MKTTTPKKFYWFLENTRAARYRIKKLLITYSESEIISAKELLTTANDALTFYRRCQLGGTIHSIGICVALDMAASEQALMRRGQLLSQLEFNNNYYDANHIFLAMEEEQKAYLLAQTIVERYYNRLMDRKEYFFDKSNNIKRMADIDNMISIIDQILNNRLKSKKSKKKRG